MNPLFSNQVSRVKPLYDYLRKQQDNQKFMRSAELTATFVLVSFFMFFAIRPTLLTISALVGDIKSKQLLKKELKTKINNVIRAQDLFSQVEGRYSVIDTSLPDRPSYFDSISQIQKVGESSGVIIDKFNFNLSSVGTSMPDQHAKAYSVNISLNNPFRESIKIIDTILKNRRLIEISEFSVGSVENKNASPSATPNAGELRSGFTATFYYWPKL